MFSSYVILMTGWGERVMSSSVVYDLEYLKNKGFFKNYGELDIDGKTVIWDKDNYLTYVEVKDLDE